MHLPWPPELVRDKALLYQAMLQHGQSLGHDSDDIERLFDLLPPELQAAEACKLIEPMGWVYVFGHRFDRMPQDTDVGGSSETPALSDLYLALSAANRCLSTAQVQAWSERLADKRKHLDALEELKPVVNLAPGAVARFEVTGQCRGDHLADWHIEHGQGPPLLFDVKYRKVDTIEHLKGIIPQLNAGADQIDPPEMDPAPLFRSTYEKFLPADPSERLQGAWIYHGIKQPALPQYFASLPQDQLHFAVFPRALGVAQVLARTDEQAELVRHVLQLQEPEPEP